MKIELIDGYYLRTIDPKNIGLCVEKTIKEGAQAGEQRETILSYHSDIETAFHYACRILTNLAGTYKELESLVERLEKLKDKVCQ